MSRSTMMTLARETVEITGRGFYTTPGGCVVDISAASRACLDATAFFSPSEAERLRQDVLNLPGAGFPTIFEVANETTLAGISRLHAGSAGPVAVLNFASAKNPGGGFLNGSQAQEESLARSSALYASLLQADEFYKRHRASPSLLYSDSVVLSPNCPIIRNDAGLLLETPQSASFITTAAPNTGAIIKNQSQELPSAQRCLVCRAEYVFAVAASQGHKTLVLGAWGCGVFGNDPEFVAAAFSGHLHRGAWSGRFERIVFSVLDNSDSQATVTAFKRRFG